MSRCTCRYYAYNRHLCSIIGDDPCEEHSNCLYKQLKRSEADLEQEKALKETYLTCYKAKHEDVEGKLFKLKAENCELKGKVKLYEEILERSAQGFETGFQASTFANIVNGVANSIRDKKLFKFKQTLAEIKKIATHCMKQDICTTCDNSEQCHIEDEGIPTYDVCKLILQKISECEGNDEKR